MKESMFLMIGICIIAWPSYAAKISLSDDTKTCIECHASIHPGIVADWERSNHSKISFENARKQKSLSRKVSSGKVPDSLSKFAIGCAECHTQNASGHKDSFEHNGFDVHIVVTPNDCSTCHVEEVNQYSKNIMSHAYGNFVNNVLYQDLANSINGTQIFKDNNLKLKKPDKETQADSCLYCHGTDVKVISKTERDTDFGKLTFPVLSGWPNQGVGRLNPDGSKGSCTSCHPRHSFSSEIARKPYTCAECHKGPDVPAYKVYMVSKHGNIYSSENKEWNFKAYPWTAGKDFSAPTCATCHISLVADSDGTVIAKRTHQMSDRLPWRIFGLIYAHPHPKSPDTTIIKNKGGLPLPTELTGEPVSKYLIDAKEQEKRQNAMKKICLSCHSSGWVDGQFARLENTIKTTDEMVLTSTKILLNAWKNGAAKGLAQKDSVFNEALEKKWIEQWLFFANTTRFASAMAGADYGAFANGRWYMSKNIREMHDWLKFKLKSSSKIKK